jgi:hypothetical protein
MLGNLSQPNLTYSLTGNCLFLMVGLMVNRHGAASLLNPQPEKAASLPATVPLSKGPQPAAPASASRSRAA